MNPKQQLKALADARRGVIVPGAFNAMSARLIADLGFEAIYVTGAGVTNMWFGMPDQGFMGLSDIADHTARIRDAVEVPLLVDADTGFGNAVNTYHAVRTLERAGADCIQLEDQVSPKRCGHFNGKAVIETSEMLGKIKAAVDARRDSGTSSWPAPTRPPSTASKPPSSVPSSFRKPAPTSCLSRPSPRPKKCAPCRSACKLPSS
jgi:2-methylisocitrate lyase-like PEP mutase family enzyme